MTAYAAAATAGSTTAASPGAVSRQARTARESVLKLYVDSTSLSLVRQVADFVASEQDSQVVRIATWLRLPLQPGDLRDGSSHYVPQLAAVSQAFVAEVGRFVRASGFDRVEIHANQAHADRSLAPLLRELCLSMPDARDRIWLELYDDGSLGPLQREVLKQQRDPVRQIGSGAADLRRAVFAGEPMVWGVAQSYAWHHLFRTRYHLLRREVLLRDEPGRVLHAHLDPFTADLDFEQPIDLTPAQTERYAHLFGVDAPLRAKLAALAADEDALMFMATGVWEPEWDARLARTQLEAIALLRRTGTIPTGVPLAFKGHPANVTRHAELASALGEDVLVLPGQLSLEVLHLLGLLPRHYGGALSTSQWTLPRERLRFVLCREDTAAGGRDAALVQLMLASGALLPEHIHALLS